VPRKWETRTRSKDLIQLYEQKSIPVLVKQRSSGRMKINNQGARNKPSLTARSFMPRKQRSQRFHPQPAG